MMQMIEEIRANQPVVVNLANSVTPQHVADAVSMLGGSPLMLEAPQEADEFVDIAQAVILNIGTITQERLALMIKVGKRANERGIPVILDPVAVGMAYRSTCLKELAAAVHFDYIRGNASEIGWFADVDVAGKGIDALDQSLDVSIAQKAALATGATILQSGVQDVISDGTKTAVVSYDNPLLAVNVGAGDMLSAVVGTFGAIADDSVDAAVAAAMAFSLAGNQAGAQAGIDRPGTYMAALYDALYQLTDVDLNAGVVAWH